MNLFLDANIIVAVLNNEYPIYSYAIRILSLANKKEHKIYTSPICLAIAFYFVEKKSGAKVAKQKIKLLVEKIKIADITDLEVSLCLKNIKINDVEDGLEYYSAMRKNCDVIITEDVNDFYFSTIPFFTSKQFMDEYLLTQKIKI